MKLEINLCSIDEPITFGLVLEKVVNFAGSTVICDDIEAFIVHVENQILTLRRSWYKKDHKIIELTITARPIKPMSPLDKYSQHEQGQ